MGSSPSTIPRERNKGEQGESSRPGAREATAGQSQPEQRVHMGLGVCLLPFRPPTVSGANKFLAEQVCVGGLITFQH